jgi:phospholipid/cholesterol/gamma-HCH transport system substrate-binding protein
MVSVADYLQEFNPELPALTNDLRKLAQVSRLYGDIAPDLLDALTDSSVTLDTVADQRAQLTGLYADVTRSAQDVTIFLRNNKDNLIRLASASRAPLEVAARYSPSFPCTLKAMTDLKPSVDTMLGAGTDEPGFHVNVNVTKERGKYVPGKDDPVYDLDSGPRCYPSGVAPTEGVAAARTGSEGHPLLAGGGDLGLPNSPQESELIATLLSPSIGEVPSWSSVLVGPLYRGTEVEIR